MVMIKVYVNQNQKMNNLCVQSSSQCYRHLVYDAWFSGREELNLATGKQ